MINSEQFSPLEDIWSFRFLTFFCQTLEELRETDRKRSAELVKILSQCSQTKEEICQIRYPPIFPPPPPL